MKVFAIIYYTINIRMVYPIFGFSWVQDVQETKELMENFS